MKIKGLYGEELTVTAWAERLGVDAELIYLCLRDGKNIADIHALLGQPYNPPKTRKSREGARMAATRERMAILLEMSEIAEREEAARDLAISRVGNNGHHRVAYKCSLLGVYNYKTGGLQLSGGSGIPLFDLEWEDVKVIQDARGLWHPHPDTQRICIDRALKKHHNRIGDVTAYHESLKKAEELRKDNRKRYEGFGKQYTCAQWERVLGVSHSTLWRALSRGESVEEFAERQGIHIKKV